MELTANKTLPFKRTPGYWDWGIRYMYRQKGEIHSAWTSGRNDSRRLFRSQILIGVKDGRI